MSGLTTVSPGRLTVPSGRKNSRRPVSLKRSLSIVLTWPVPLWSCVQYQCTCGRTMKPRAACSSAGAITSRHAIVP